MTSTAPPSPPLRTPAAVPPGGYRLLRTPPEPVPVPRLDAAQREVAAHRRGPLLVLAGPGTGKTTTLVESVAARVRGGTRPERVLVLTFSRKAAAELRDRTAARIEGPGTPLVATFHSFCYALVREHQHTAAPDLFAEPLRLMSGPEQDVFVRDLLAGQADLERDGRARPHWPDELRAARGTRGFADEVRAVLARSRELGLGPAALGAFAARIGRPDWEAAAAFLAEYLDVLDMSGVIDYAELVHRAVLLAGRPEVARALAGRFEAVYVDEYQDTDPAQVRLLRALTGERVGGTLVAFGDPDQSIYAFRGADVGGILDFPTTFRHLDGRPADVRVLTVSRRSRAALLAATRQVAARLPLPRLPADAVRAHRALTPERDGGRVTALTFPTPGAELDGIADLLRRAHLEEGVPWGDMAVLVRAGARSLPGLRRALTVAGVPIDIDGDDLPLRAEPAVAPLLAALRVCARAVGKTAAGVRGVGGGAGTVGADARDADADARADAERDPGDRRDTANADPARPAAPPISVDEALALLTSPLGGMDAGELRRLGRALRDEERAAGRAVPRPSDVLVAEALAEPERLAVHRGSAPADRARQLGTLLREVRDALLAGATAEEALWRLWSGTGWPGRLERAALRGGAAGRNADRDLDAVCALFETAARAEERAGGRGAANFLEEIEAQDIAADLIGRRAHRPDAVRLMTAHRAKGLQWPLVVVAGVQDGLWPDLRRRGSLLEADRIGRDGLAEPLTPGALLAEERRLFYVAATRARDRLVVTAVKAPAEDGDQPSRFLTELGVEPRDVTQRPRRPLAVAALVAELRATTVDPAASPALRAAATERLARLAALTDDEGRPLVPAAHPERWWGLWEPTRSVAPVRDPEQPVALSGSALDQLVNTCSLQWFLGREVKAEPSATAAQGFGTVLHVLADEVGSGRTPADLDVLLARLDSVWDSLAFDAPWASARERDQARAALERFLHWHVLQRGREPLATEHSFDLELPAGDYRVRVRGSMDRVERDAEGRAYVVDFKTGRAKPTAAAVEQHPQLAVYQLAVREGAVDTLFAGDRPEPGGAELVHLRLPAPAKSGGDALPATQPQDPLPPPDPAAWPERLLAEAAARVLDERFTPSPGSHCDRCAFRTACSARPEGKPVVE